MIDAICDGINDVMKALGYIETDDEDTLVERRYTLRFEPLVTDSETRGAFGLGKVRVSRIVHIRVQYPSSKRPPRWRRGIALEQETIAVKIYVVPISVSSQQFMAAGIEETEDGIISDVALRFLGEITT